MGVCTGKAKKSYTYREKRKLRHCTKRRSIEQRNKKNNPERRKGERAKGDRLCRTPREPEAKINALNLLKFLV